MDTLDLSLFVDDNLTSEVLAYEHALDLAYLFVQEMDACGLTRKQLAEKMGIPQSRLSKLLNTQPNMTLETIAQFELALNIRIDFSYARRVEGTLCSASRIVPKPEMRGGWQTVKMVDWATVDSSTAEPAERDAEFPKNDSPYNFERVAA